MNHRECRCELLGSSEIGHVTVCQGCGQVHLNMQYMSLRFEVDAFRALAAMLGQAQRRLDCVRKAGAAAVDLGVPGTLH